MQTSIERWWTNREDELNILAQIVRGERQERVFVIRAGAGYGKSWLIDRIEDWCRREGVPCTRMDFDKSREGMALSAEVVLEKAVETLRAPGMTAVERETVVRLIAEWRGGGASVSVAEEAKFKETGWYGDVANFIVKDLHVHAAGEGEPPALRRRRATKRFCESLPAFAVQPLAWLVDTCEQADADTADWLCGEVVRRIARGELPIVLVLAGRREFDMKSTLEGRGFDLKPEWEHAVCRLTLAPFDEVKTYQLAARAGLSLHEQAVAMLLALTGGVPLELVRALERYAQSRGIALWPG